MKRLMIALGTIVTALYLASLPALAQGRPGGGSVGASHGPSSHRGSSSTAGSTNTVPSPLSTNPHLGPKLAKALIKSGALPQGSTSGTLKTDCTGFHNLGQCIAALHVARNRGINFFCLKADMLDTTSVIPQGTACPAGTGTGTKKLSLGQSIQKLDPNADAKTETTKATKQANDDIKNAGS